MNFIEEMFGLTDKIVVITGGAGVIAHSMSEALLKAGAKVALWDIAQEHVDTVQKSS